MTRRTTAFGLLVASIWLASPGSGPRASVASAQDVDAVTREVVDIEGDLRRLTDQPLRRSRLRSPTYVEERLTDGELFYRLQDYVRASIIFTDIVENYQSHRAYPDALFLLADSLFRAGDYLGARTRFREVIDHVGEPAFAPYVQRALGRLIEIAIHTRDFDGVEGYFAQLSRIPPSEIEATTNYFRAKYLYNRAVPTEDVLREDGPPPRIDQTRLEQARQAFEAVQQGSPYYPQARYFIGVIYTLREQYPQAIEAFRRVLRSPAETQEQREVLELTQLSLGRLYYETDQLDQAVEAYQAIPRTSENFHVALYEIAWVYIRMGDSTRAERALEVLTVAAPESRFIPDGKLLRANLLLRNGRHEDANRVFREVAREFGPVRRELDEMMESHDDPQAYFRQLVRENMESFDAHAFLPPLAQRWAEMEGDMDRALEVLSDLSQARRLVRETSELVERLEAALNQPNRVAVFADLRLQMERSTALRNRVAQSRRDLLRIYEQRHPDRASSLRDTLSQIRSIERFLDGMPTDEGDFADFDDEVLGRYRRLGRELGRLEVELQGMEARIVAMERYLEDTEEDRDPEGVEAIRTELAGHREAVEAYREQIRQLEIALEAARLQVGPGDARYQRHERLRREHARLLRQVRERLGDSQLAGLFTRLDRVETQLDQREQEVERIVEERTAEIRRQLQEEAQNIVGYRQQLTQLESETEEVVGAVTYENFRQVQHRFYDLVLRADVGRIDVAWAEREEHRMRVEMLTRDRAREMRALDDEFREIMDETSEDEGGEESGEVEP
ncbi:MAG TPA: tetratricopeptide repeat protein [Sandaracinaceae bacterium LLY-WYZ-13_1]|nr:tetratricopeptide repeat protein [Sandaracinaceae bacterium LLY-WYZ-13_1]